MGVKGLHCLTKRELTSWRNAKSFSDLASQMKPNKNRRTEKRHLFHLQPLPPENVHLCLHQKRKQSANTLSGEKTQNRKYASVSRKSFIQKSISTNLCYLKLNWECIRAVIMEFVSTVICQVVFGPYVVIAVHDNNPKASLHCTTL